ncbi:MAG: phospholipid carrier-dependent glycosyltransferase [Defluviitaleaceae bacterium]|nr:phospholipid carrier-dependent glycosyltransferase [Defluviitaleaceae bacterium]
MSIVYGLAALAGLIVVLACVSQYRLKNLRVSPYLYLIAISFLVRILLFHTSAGYDSDIATFKYWANALWNNGISRFYTGNYYSDYPPGYMYVLYILGMLQSKLGLSDASFTTLIKMPSVICDVLMTVFIYKLAIRKFSPKISFFLGLAFALSPAFILDSSVWGQVDSVHTLLLLVSVSLLADKKYTRSFMLYAVAILVKPQSLIAAPVFIYGYAAGIFYAEKGKRKKVVIDLVIATLLTLWLLFILVFPFADGWNVISVFKVYVTDLTSYPYASVNAYNLYTFLGGNWADINARFWGMTYNYWGILFIILISLFSVFLMYLGKGKKSSYFAVTGMLYVLVFMLSAKMHERYMLPALVFFLAAYIYKPDKKFLLLYGGFTLTCFLNCVDILYALKNGNDLSLISTSMRYVSLLNIILSVVLIVCMVYLYWKEKGAREREEDLPQIPFYERHGPVIFEKTRESSRLVKRDFLLMLGLTVFYGIIAFINLGNLHSPQTTWAPQDNQSAVLELQDNVHVAKFEVMFGARENKNFKMETSPDGVNWSTVDLSGNAAQSTGAPADGTDNTNGGLFNWVSGDGVFRWSFRNVSFYGPYIRITSAADMLMIQEIGFRDDSGSLIPLISVDGGQELCDEQSLVPDRQTYMNSTYFDEIYHARTAYEFIHALWPYENTHPPLGKDIIAVGVAVFGMTPFGWRVMGTLCGIFMIPLMFIFAKRIFKKTNWAFFASFIFAFDFMHFAQTRISTIDSYVTFFIMAMYLFMYEFARINFFDSDGKWRHSAFKQAMIMLGLSGLSMGFAIASKWEGIYGAVGLPVLLFYTLYKRWKEYLWAKKYNTEKENDDDTEKENENASENAVIAAPFERVRYFPRYILITAGVCVGMFLIVPAVIYCLSYIPFLRAENIHTIRAGISEILKEQPYMLHYHEGVNDAHPYSSRWFEWPLMTKPIYYYAGTTASGLREGISSFGNPAVWWMGIVAVIYCIWQQSKKFSLTILFLFVAYASQYLPWIFIHRTTFIYHYFPSVPFVVLLVTFFFKDFVVETKNKPKLAIAFLIAVFVLFVLFYPTISGMAVPARYADVLRVFPSWVLS